MVNIILPISKNEMEFLVKNGVKFGEDGISHTTSRHRKNYFLCMSRKNAELHQKYEDMIYHKS